MNKKLIFIVLIFSYNWQISFSQGLSISPGLTRMVNDNLAVNLKANFNTDFEWDIIDEDSTNYPKSVSLKIDIKGEAIRNPSQNPSEQYLDLVFDYLISFSKPEIYEEGVDPEGETNWGLVGAGLNLRYESNQSFDEQNLAFGFDLRYSNSELTIIPIPAVVLSYSFVKPFKSNIRSTFNEEKELHQRFSFKILLPISIYNKEVFTESGFTSKRFIEIIPEFRYFKTYGMSDILTDFGFEEGAYGSVTLAINNLSESEAGERGFKILNLFLRGSYGQMPISVKNRETIEAGIGINF